MMNRRFAFAWAWCIGVVLAAPVAAQAPLELDHGEQITVSCAPAPPACPPSCGDGTCDPGERCTCTPDCGSPPMMETGLCGDGIDNDCDGLTDCVDSDCSADPACAPSAGPPLAGLEGWWRWDSAHAVECGTEPPVQIGAMGDQPPTGACIHHLPDQSPANREASETEPEWWPVAEVDGIMFDGDSQLILQNCTGCNPGPCVCEQKPFLFSSTEPWAVVFAGYVHATSHIVGYGTDPQSSAYIKTTETGLWRYRASGSALSWIATVPLFERTAVVVERRLDGALVTHRSSPCSGGFVDVSLGQSAPAAASGFGCWGCYSPNTTAEEWPGTIFFREGMLYRWAFNASERAQLFAYLDRPVAEGGHREWIDAGCE
jgi:hypothetical protein